MRSLPSPGAVVRLQTVSDSVEQLDAVAVLLRQIAKMNETLRIWNWSTDCAVSLFLET